MQCVQIYCLKGFIEIIKTVLVPKEITCRMLLNNYLIIKPYLRSHYSTIIEFDWGFFLNTFFTYLTVVNSVKNLLLLVFFSCSFLASRKIHFPSLSFFYINVIACLGLTILLFTIFMPISVCPPFFWPALPPNSCVYLRRRRRTFYSKFGF